MPAASLVAPRRRPVALALVAALAPAVAACSPAKVDATVTVAGSDTACVASPASVAAGRIEFAFTNSAAKTNELYVKRGDKILGEKEDVAPGATRSVAVSLKAGTYTVVCKPGQVGDGIVTPFTVTG